MELLFVRHGRAQDREVFARTGEPDERRPLTPDGCKRMKEAARGLRRVLPNLAVVATSPLLRARQSADLLGDAYGLQPQESGVLAPGAKFEEVYAWAAQQSADLIALVGHEPDLGMLASHLLAGAHESFLPLKRGACCLIDCGVLPRAGGGKLLWLLTSAQLRRIGEAG